MMRVSQDPPVLALVRTRLTQLLLIFIIVSNLALVVAQVQAGQLDVPLIVAALVTIGMFITLSLGYGREVIIDLTVIYLAGISYSVVGDDLTLVLLLGLAAVAAALTASIVGYGVTIALIALRVLWHLVLYGSALQAQGRLGEVIFFEITGAAVLGAMPLVISAMIRYFVTVLRQTADTAQRTASLLGASASIGQSISNMLALDDLLNETVTIIRDRFAFYHVQIFLIDDAARYAHLTASTGEVGQAMLARQHRLPLDSNSVVGRTVRAGEPIVSQDTASDAIHAYNELLPHTRSELGLPILIGNEVIGALDVQSTRRNAFSAGQIQALQVIASQLASAIRNARLFEQQTRNSNENKRLFIEAETRLRQIEQLNRRLTQQAWTDYLAAQQRVSGVTFSQMAFEHRADWTDAMLEARRRRRAIVHKGETHQVVAVPVQLRGEVIGALEVEAPLDQQDAVEILEAIGQRLATSLDNARLFEEAQITTAQENRLNEIVSQYPAAPSVDELLKLTLKGLVETLGAETGAIRLGAAGMHAPAPPPVQHNGSGTPAPEGGPDA